MSVWCDVARKQEMEARRRKEEEERRKQDEIDRKNAVSSHGIVVNAGAAFFRATLMHHVAYVSTNSVVFATARYQPFVCLSVRQTHRLFVTIRVVGPMCIVSIRG